MRIGLESHNLHCRCRNVGKSERSVCDLAIVVVNDERNGVERVRRTHGNNAFLVLFKHLVGIAVICRYDECVIVLFDDRKRLARARSTASTPILVASRLPVWPTISPFG